VVGRPFAKDDPRINRTIPGTGRPKNALRSKMRAALEVRLQIAEGIADAEDASNADKLRALDFLAKYGLGSRNSMQKHEHGVTDSLAALILGERRTA
jgi:hypothetical protein